MFIYIYTCVCVRKCNTNEVTACRPSRVPKACLGPVPQIPFPHTAEGFLAADRHCPGAIDGEREGPRRWFDFRKVLKYFTQEILMSLSDLVLFCSALRCLSLWAYNGNQWQPMATMSRPEGHECQTSPGSSAVACQHISTN